MLPAKCYCFNVAKTNAAISLERVNKCNCRGYKLLGVGSVGAIFAAESLIEHCLYLIYLYEFLGPGREDMSGQWSVSCSHLLEKTMRWVYKKSDIKNKSTHLKI